MLETESRWTIAEQTLCAIQGVAFSMDLKRRLLGTHLDRAGATLAEWFGHPPDQGPVQAAALIAAYREAIDAHGVEPMPGALELVNRLTGRLPIAVASNTNVVDTRRVLARSALPDEAFEAVVCAGDGIAPKPAPDVYLAACAALGADPARTIAFEDSPVGARAARAAGMFVVGVPSTPGSEPDADLIIASLADIDATGLLDGIIT